MSHASQNFKTKKELKAAIAEGKKISTFNPSGMFPVEKNGTDVVEGPWQFHKWYAGVIVKDGIITKVTS